MNTPPRLTVLIAALVTACLCGCTSLRGHPEPLLSRADALAAVRTTYPRSTVLLAFASEDNAARGGLTQRAYRDLVADTYLAASEANYLHFKTQLSQELKGSTFGLNLLVLGLNGLGSISGEGTANALAAASSTLVGANSSISKDLFQERAITAIITTMDASRARAKTEIRRQLLTMDEKQLRLGDVLNQIDALDTSSSLYAAATEVEATASAAKAEADREAAEVSLGAIPILGAGAQASNVAFAQYVRQLNDAAVLGQLRVALGAAEDADVARLKSNIIISHRLQVASGDYAAISDRLKPITGRDFK